MIPFDLMIFGESDIVNFVSSLLLSGVIWLVLFAFGFIS